MADWVSEVTDLCKPSHVHLCDGSPKEYDQLARELVAKKVFVPLIRPHSFWCHSTPDDVARVEEATYICSRKKEDAGPTNNWKDPHEMKVLLRGLFAGSMQGRTLYIIPYCMGPFGAPLARIGVQITDSPYVVCNMHIMTRMGAQVLERLKNHTPFVPCLHSVGVPLKPGEKDVPWPCRPDQKYIVQFPEERSIWSFGSGYGGNALLGKKSLALRIASVMGRDEGWMAEHMLIMGLTNPAGEKKYIAAAFPSQCGKTNLALLKSPLPGWKVHCVGDDIAWMHFGKDGRLYAINPEAGFFGVAPGTTETSNPNAMRIIEKNTIFTNTAVTEERDVWWEGLTKEPPPHLRNWLSEPWVPGTPASHPNARFTSPLSQCTILDPDWNNPEGVPISAILFGGRRASLEPLVYESFSWQHGVFVGASLSSETTAAAKGAVGTLRHDPFAMLPFCGYNMGDYFQHWLNMQKQAGAKLPKIFHVNWFRKSKEGKYLWPGFGENIHVLKWIFERVAGTAQARESFLGQLPALGLFAEELLSLDPESWRKEVADLKHYFTIFGSHLPDAVRAELDALEKRIS